ncbi:ATP-dependent DNA ligase [Bradyrhizobium sp. 41S5]|uniref:ATP-dependent DNA ligase n=1 Tax=Bradyrhizobium sp. 41S5 TaxID=1404443 RepID=UPI001E4B6352|nr:DNA ligase [Bradyrhizobium sp. 41S5]
MRREGARVRCFTKGGYDWADRFPAIAQAALALKAQSFLIDREAVVCGLTGCQISTRCSSRRRDRDAVLFAFNLIEHDGSDLRDLALLDRKQRLAKLVGKALRAAIQFNDHLDHDGAAVFSHACKLGLEGIVSKRIDAPYRSGASKTWLKSKNPASAAVRRERDEDWG